MERNHGVPFADIWASLAWDAKLSCVKDVANIMAQLFELRYDAIGNLFHAKDLPVEFEHTSQDNAAKSDIIVLDQTVSMAVFWNKHLKSDVHRGTFVSSKE